MARVLVNVLVSRPVLVEVENCVETGLLSLMIVETGVITVVVPEAVIVPVVVTMEDDSWGLLSAAELCTCPVSGLYPMNNQRATHVKLAVVVDALPLPPLPMLHKRHFPNTTTR